MTLLNRHISLCTMALTACFTLQAQPRVEWTAMEHDFGAFSEDDGDAVCCFTMVNTGDEPLSVISVRTSCGCTSADIPRDIIFPGDSAHINVIYNPIGRPGRFEKKVMVETNGEPQKSTLRIHGVVIGSPGSLRSRYPVDAGNVRLRGQMMAFGEVRMGTVKSATFEVYNAGTEAITPEWSGVPPYLHITTTTPSIPPGEQGVYSLMFYADKRVPYGLLDLAMQLTPEPGAEPIDVSLVANVVEDFSRHSEKDRLSAPQIVVDTQCIDFGEYTPASGTPIVRKFTITNRGKRPLQLHRLYSASPAIAIDCPKTTVKSGKSVTVTVTFTPSLLPADAELLDGRINIIANDPDHPTTLVRVAALPE